MSTQTYQIENITNTMLSQSTALMFSSWTYKTAEDIYELLVNDVDEQFYTPILLGIKDLDSYFANIIDSPKQAEFLSEKLSQAGQMLEAHFDEFWQQENSTVVFEDFLGGSADLLSDEAENSLKLAIKLNNII